MFILFFCCQKGQFKHNYEEDYIWISNYNNQVLGLEICNDSGMCHVSLDNYWLHDKTGTCKPPEAEVCLANLY